jgi:LDH2 family malate/lactate/ureidoglycolate dehydrogenase
MKGIAVPTYDSNKLKQIATALFEAAGVPSEEARAVARSLVTNEQFGHNSHGMRVIPNYVKLIQRGHFNLHASIGIVHESASTAVIDGHWGLGQVVATPIMRCAMDKAKQSGVASVGVYHLQHVGRLGEFTEIAAVEGFAAIAMAGGTPESKTPNVAPFGGARAVWGTNPIAIAIPVGNTPFLLDFATSIIAAGKAHLARSKDIELPNGCAIDREGHPTRDPGAIVQGGALLPFGGHKGYGLAFAVELLAGALAGGAAPELTEGAMGFGLFIILFDLGCFRPITSFETTARVLFRRVKACPALEGFQEVLIPGELERRNHLASERRGIYLPDSIFEDLNNLGQKLGVTLEW